jgi:hypothetical protein
MHAAKLHTKTLTVVIQHGMCLIQHEENVSQVYEFVQLPELYYAGSHGMDIMGPADGCGGCKANGTRAVDDRVILIKP